MKNTAKIGLWLALLIFAVPAMAMAQDADVIQAPPTYVVGDTWEYDGGFSSLEDAKAGKNSKWVENQMATRIVREVNDKTIVIGNPRGNRRYIYDKSLNLLESHVNEVDTFYKPLRGPIYKYPMQPGNKYNVSFSYNRPDGTDNDYSATVKVHGWETVTVPAGTFKALKVEMYGYWEHPIANTMPPQYGRADFKEIFWLASEVKMRHVLYLYEASWGSGSRSYYESLKSYKMK